jgi:uncharacterized protein (DUF362 family)/Pyruvate/2-oxoacid:ferredoxin oxidoreductase delta subunit
MKDTVSIVRCETYDESEVLDALRRSIHLVGGVDVKRGSRVLLKPNLLLGKPPEKAVNTHPAVLKGIIRIVREKGGIPFVGDSPAIGSCLSAAQKAGVRQVAEEAHCPIVEFNRPVVCSSPDGARFRQLEIDRSVLEADLVINLPKWKTHGMVLLTLGVKNMFGCVSGPRKALCHLKAGEDRKLFSRMLVDVYRRVGPCLTVLDGVVGMEGNGPASGRPVHLGLMMAGSNAFAVDQIVCDLLKIPRRSVPTNLVALEDGIACDEIEVVGLKIADVETPPFELPSLGGTSWGLPPVARTIVKKALMSRPSVEEERCRRCEQCIDICPPKALRRKGDHFSLDDAACIRCFCCQEVCPEGAISIVPGWASKLIGRVRRRRPS